MNRRGFFSFLPGAAVGVAAAAVIAPPATADNVVRAATNGYRCDGGGKRECGCTTWHVTSVYAAMRLQPVCTWCGADWKGPTT